MKTVQDQFEEEIRRIEEAMTKLANQRSAFYLHRFYARQLPPIIQFSRAGSDSATRLVADASILAFVRKSRTKKLTAAKILKRAFADWYNSEAPPPTDIRNNLYRLRDAGYLQQTSDGAWQLTARGETLFSLPEHSMPTNKDFGGALSAGGEMPEV
jgi:hypothetical protein